MSAPSDLSVVIGLALLTTDRDADEDAALARVIAVAGLGDLFPGTQGTPAVSSLTEDVFLPLLWSRSELGTLNKLSTRSL